MSYQLTEASCACSSAATWTGGERAWSFKASLSLRSPKLALTSPAELCNTFIHLKRPLQASVSSKLQRALSSFISSSSLEFGALNAANRRLEGGPEVLFDIIYTLSEGSKKKDFCWPVMASLLTLCPDIVGKLVVGEGARSPGVTKKVRSTQPNRLQVSAERLA